MHHTHCLVLLSLLIGGCAGAPTDDAEPVPDDPDQQPAGARMDSKLVIASAAIDNGPPWFGATVQAELSERTPLQAWTFDLPRAAAVGFATRGTATGPDVDTVLYLYRLGARGWGSYLARNDDLSADSVFSALTRTLKAGHYRVVVRGRTPHVHGPFALAAECQGEGCPSPAAPRGCLFGSKVSDMPFLLRVSNILTFTSAAQLPDEHARMQLLESAAHVPDANVASAPQLLAQVDGGMVRWMRIWDDVAGRQFTAYEYRLGEASYGAIFAVEGGAVVARVSDARLVDCHVAVERCALGTTYRALLSDPRFEVLSSATLDLQSAAALSDSEQTQLLQAARVAYDDAGDLASAFASVDGNRINRLVLNQIDTGRHLAAYEYGAGDNSYGAVFGAADLTLLARIEDGAFQACALRD
jgi:hypothetical protein